MDGSTELERVLVGAARTLSAHSLILKGMAEALANLTLRVESLEGKVERLEKGGRF